MSTSSYGLNPTDLRATVEHLIRQRVAFRYDPEGRFVLLLPDLTEPVATQLAALLTDPLEWVFITAHCGPFTRPEMEAKWAADRRRSDERSAYWSDYLNSP